MTRPENVFFNELAALSKAPHITAVSECILVVLTTEGIVQFINENGQKVVGKTLADLVDTEWLRSIPEHDHETIRSALSDLAASPHHGTDIRKLDTGLIDLDGEERTISWSYSMLEGDECAPCVLWSGVDVTNHIRGRLELQENEARLQAILDTAVDGIITIDENGVIETFNNACGAMFGYHQDEVIGQKINMLMPEPYRGEHDTYMNHYLNTGCAKIIGIGREVQGLRKDGTVFPIDLAVSETRLETRRIFTGIIKDITERKLTEERLENAREELMLQSMFTQRLSALAAMAGGIAHELNQPLSGIRVYAETVRNYVARTEADANGRIDLTLQKIIKQVDRAAAVIEHMREFASDKSRLTPESVSIHDAVDDVLDLIGQQLRNHGINFINDVPPDLTIQVNRNRIEQVFVNLFENAKDGIREKHDTSAGNHIRVTAERAGGYTVIRIADTGSGIPSAVREHVFEPFVTSKGPDRGTGLGLSISHGILRDYGAQIALESTGANGTVFAITFPGESDEW